MPIGLLRARPYAAFWERQCWFFYGLGVIIGAGIYVLVGTIVARAGGGAPWSFVLAGILAAMTGLSYAELAVRFPEAAGAAAYVKEAFGSDTLSKLTGLAVAAVVIVSTASIARGSAGYIQSFAPLSDPVIASGLVALFTAIACLRVRESIGLAAVMTLIEIEPSQGNADASIRDGVAPVYNHKCAWPAPSEVQADFRDCIRSLLPERLGRPPRDHASMVRTRRISSVLRPIAWGRRTPGSATTS